jgi:hypothetical protein
MTHVSDIVKTLANSAQARGISDPAKLAEYAAAKQALNAEAKANWGNPAWHAEVAAVVAARLDYMGAFENPFAAYLRTHSIGEGDFLEIKERRGLKAFWTARGAYIEESQIFANRFTVPRDTIGFHITEFEDKAAVNFGETIEAVMAMGYAKMESTIAESVFATFEAVYDVSSDYYVPVSGDLTKEVLDATITEVFDQARPDNWAAREVTIFGRRAAVDQILNVASTTANLFVPSISEGIQNTGRLGVYRGANIVVVPNYHDGEGNSFVPNDSLWVFGNDIGDFVNYGGTKAKTWNDPTVDYWHAKARKDVGWALSHPEYGRRIQLLEESS